MLSSRAVHDVKFALKYLVAPISHAQETAVGTALRQDLTRNLGRAQAPVFDALRSSVDQTWGYDEITWKEVSLFETMQDCVHRAVNCVLVGSPLCREKKYLDSLSRFATWLGAGSVIVGQFTPWFLVPLFGNLVLIPVTIYRRKSLKYLLPAIEDRMRYIQKSEKDMSPIEPKDLITWIILGSRDSTAVEIADMILGLVSHFQLTFTQHYNLMLCLSLNKPSVRIGSR